MKKRIALIIVSVLFLLVTLTACTKEEKSNDKTYMYDKFSIVLPNTFSIADMSDDYYSKFSIVYETQESIIFVTKDEVNWDSLGFDFETMTINDYGEVFISNFNDPNAKVENVNGVSYAYYEDEFISYFASFTKGSDAFWLVQFGCRKNDYDTMKPGFIKWAQTIKVK